MGIKIVNLAAAIIILGLFGGPADDAPLSCGQSSCFLLLRLLGHQVELSDLNSEFGGIDAEYSLAHLQDVLVRRGVPSTGYRVTWEEFQQVQGPMIVHLDYKEIGLRHFHVVKWDGPVLRVVEPLASHPLELNSAQFDAYREQFSGRILVPMNGEPFSWRVLGSWWLIPCAAFAVLILYELFRRLRLVGVPNLRDISRNIASKSSH